MALVLISLISCELKKNLTLCEEGVSLDNRLNDVCHPKLMSYHFGVDKLSVPQQTRLLKNLNMDGMIINIETSTLELLGDYYRTHEVQNENFQIYDIFTSVSMDDPVVMEQQLSTIDAIYKKIACTETMLQVIFYGSKSNIYSSITRIADIANYYDKELVIYPHDKTAIESAEEALTYITTSNKGNVYLSVHLCHELAAGNGGRIEEVVKNVSPYIKSVSMSGATESEQSDNTLPLWYWAIKPLDMGTYDYSVFYQSLYDNNYYGPIAIHTWGIYENFGLQPQDHLPISQQIISDLTKTICE